MTESAIRRFWVTHASRVWVSASRRNELYSVSYAFELSRFHLQSKEKFREPETASPARETRALPKPTCSRPNV
jgi:hypothetical protein